jgi:ceramide glucosyltransferase
MITALLSLLCIGSVCYYLACIFASERFFSKLSAPGPSSLPPVTIMIPLCGKDFEAHENYASFCHLDYPDYQIVFGVASEEDSSIPVIWKLTADFPHVDIDLVIDSSGIGENPKVNNLHNMVRMAKHEIIVLVDSDVRVEANYLSSIVSELIGERASLVTCLYRAGEAPNWASKIEAVGITGEFAPGVLVAWLTEGVSFAFGATIMTTKENLEAIGGFHAIADYLADDYMLGRLMSQGGGKVMVSSHVVELVLPPTTLRSMLKHQTRWARGIRACRPWGYFGSIVTHGTALAVLLMLFTQGSALSLSILAITLFTRMAMIRQVGIQRFSDRLLRRYFWLVPLRDLFGFVVWCLGQVGKTVEWRGRTFTLTRDGKMTPSRNQGPGGKN